MVATRLPADAPAGRYGQLGNNMFSAGPNPDGRTVCQHQRNEKEHRTAGQRQVNCDHPPNRSFRSLGEMGLRIGKNMMFSPSMDEASQLCPEDHPSYESPEPALLQTVFCRQAEVVHQNPFTET
jgi:hypothetical protein